MALSSAESRAVVQFGRNERIRLEEVRDNFKEKGSFGLRWDSRVSSNEKRSWWYFYLFTFRKSDKTVVLAEIEKYIKLYKNIENIEDLTFDQIEAMEKDVKEALKKAKLNIKSTDSSAVYKACNALISSKIDKDIEKVKNAVRAQEFKKLSSKVNKKIEEESEKWKQPYQAELDKMRKANEKQAKDHKNQTEELQGQISAANSRVQKCEKALLFFVKYLEENDVEFPEEVQRMIMEDQTSAFEIEAVSLVAIED